MHLPVARGVSAALDFCCLLVERGLAMILFLLLASKREFYGGVLNADLACEWMEGGPERECPP